MNINVCSVREVYLVLMIKVLYIKIVYLNNNLIGDKMKCDIFFFILILIY